MFRTSSSLLALSLVALAGCAEEPATVFLPGAPDASAADAGGRDAGTNSTVKPSMDAGTGEPTGSKRDAARPAASTFKLSSPVADDGASLPVDFRCQEDGPGPSPELSWTEGPEGTASYAVVLRDVTNATRQNIHWVVYDIPVETLALPEGVPQGAALEDIEGAKQARNYANEPGYRGPCAPEGTNKYEFVVYALPEAVLPGVRANTASAMVVKTIEDSALGEAKLAVDSSAE
jgi:Raf kinase inhibitor-like YbhB/YbcL family protein